jgi:hypothetical protein
MSSYMMIARPWEVDNIIKEFNNHELFYDNWKVWLKSWNINSKVRVPKVYKWDVDWSFVMEKIEWQSLYSKTLIERFDKSLSLDDKDMLSRLSDKQVREFLKDKLWEKDSHLDMIIEDYSRDQLTELLWTSHTYRKKYWKIWWTPLSDTLKELNEKWISHADLHPWNIMLDNKWNTYIIDFWRINKPNN